MIHAGNYGNALAFITNSPNTATAFMVGQAGGFAGHRPVGAYSAMRTATTPPTILTTAGRIASNGAAIVGWHGPRPVAFPLTVGWNYDVALT